MAADLGPVYTGPDKFLQGRILILDRLFTWIRANSFAVVFTRIRAKIRPVPPVPCKRKVEPCKFLSVQRFVRTRVNGALVFLNA